MRRAAAELAAALLAWKPNGTTDCWMELADGGDEEVVAEGEDDCWLADEVLVGDEEVWGSCGWVEDGGYDWLVEADGGECCCCDDDDAAEPGRGGDGTDDCVGVVGIFVVSCCCWAIIWWWCCMWWWWWDDGDMLDMLWLWWLIRDDPGAAWAEWNGGECIEWLLQPVGDIRTPAPVISPPTGSTFIFISKFNFAICIINLDFSLFY